MVPTVQPPASAQSGNTAHDMTTSIEDAIQSLHDLIFKIALPKTKTAKIATITIETLNLAHNLVSTVRASLTDQRESPQLRSINRQLETITAHLALPSTSPPNKKCSYAAALAMGTHGPAPANSLSPRLPPHPRPRPATHFDITLNQKSPSNPVFADTPYYDLITKILEALRDADCWMEGRLCLPDSEGDEKVKYVSPYIRAVGRHRSGDIWVATHTEAGRDMLMATVDRWLPKLSGQLYYTCKTYPVLVHGVPTSLDPPKGGEDGEDIATLLINDNADIITHPAVLKHMEFLTHNIDKEPRKVHRSLVMHFTDRKIANQCIDRHIMLHDRILLAVKFVRRPPQCYNCYGVGHLACSCNRKTSCGLCAEEHDTRHCCDA